MEISCTCWRRRTDRLTAFAITHTRGDEQIHDRCTVRSVCEPSREEEGLLRPTVTERATPYRCWAASAIFGILATL